MRHPAYGKAEGEKGKKGKGEKERQGGKGERGKRREGKRLRTSDLGLRTDFSRTAAVDGAVL
jgi:hypothetical protein